MALPKLGSRAQDRVTGFTGTVTAEIRYLERGRRSFCIESVDAQGKPCELWVSNARIVSAAAPIPEPDGFGPGRNVDEPDEG